MKAVVTVLGKDTVGIIKEVSTILADHQVNILDISQTIMQDMFTMIMLVDIGTLTVSFSELSSLLFEAGERMGLHITVQQKDIFDSMHRI